MDSNKIGAGGFTTLTKCARLFAVGLDTQLTSWRIRHPQALNHKGHERLHALNPVPYWAIQHEPLTGGMGREPKKTPPSVHSLVVHCLAATRSAISKHKEMATMVYTFIVAHSSQKLAQLKKLRTVSTFAHSEEQARKNFPGMPLVLQARTHAHRMQGGAA